MEMIMNTSALAVANESMCDSCPSDCKDYCIQKLNSIDGNRIL